MKIVPSIDIFNNKAVRLQQGEQNSIKYYDIDPVDYANNLLNKNIELIHIVNLEAALPPHITNDSFFKILENIRIPFQIGGGIRSRDNAIKYFDSGAARVVIGTSFLDNYKIWQNIDRDKLVVSLDVNNFEIKTKGWTKYSDWRLEQAINLCMNEGIKEILVTSIEKDGMLQGPDLKLYKYIKNNFAGIKLFSSGGVSSTQDIKELNKIGVEYCITGKALFENRFTIEEANNAIKKSYSMP